MSWKIGLGNFLYEAVVQHCYVYYCQRGPCRKKVLGNRWCFLPLLGARWCNIALLWGKGKITFIIVQCKLITLSLGLAPLSLEQVSFTKCLLFFFSLCLAYSLWKGAAIYMVCSHPLVFSLLEYLKNTYSFLLVCFSLLRKTNVGIALNQVFPWAKCPWDVVPQMPTMAFIPFVIHKRSLKRSLSCSGHAASETNVG